MRNLMVMAMVSLDGVMQAPGRADEDTSGEFKYGGWTAPYYDKAVANAFEKMMEPADLLLGRKTYEIFASYWPEHSENWPGINEVTKYVFSNTMKNTMWINSKIIKSLADLIKLKNSEGGMLKVWSSSKLVSLLIENEMVDELWLITYPVILGAGKKLFSQGSLFTAFTLEENMVTPGGVIFCHYIKTGKVEVGTVDNE